MGQSPRISKSAYIRGLQCHKSLYLYKHRYFLRDPMPASQQLKFRRGHSVGELAQQLFPGGMNLKPGHPSQYKKASDSTREVIAIGQEVIYEAVFAHGNLISIMDILVKKDGKWNAYEVKSSAAISETYIEDLTFQVYVMSLAGFAPDESWLICLNDEYLFDGEIDIEKLFVKHQLTDEVNKRIGLVPARLEAMFEMLEQKNSPEVKVGTHCRDPYPCDFIGHCHRFLPRKSILDVVGIDEAELYRLANSGFKEPHHALQICDSLFVRNQVNSLETEKPIFDRAVVEEWLQQNISSIDVAAMHIVYLKYAVPIIAGTRPYEPIPIAAAIQFADGRTVSVVFGDNSPISELEEFVSTHAQGNELLVLDDSMPERDDIEIVNLFPLFLSGAWTSPQFAPEYSAERIRQHFLSPDLRKSWTELHLENLADRVELKNVAELYCKWQARSVWAVWEKLVS